jgi:hypothetical protein
MRIVDVVLLSVVLGAATGLLPSWQGSAAGLTSASPDRASRSLGERLVWLRTPAMQARRGAQ